MAAKKELPKGFVPFQKKKKGKKGATTDKKPPWLKK